ncbi:MAG: universal stress protein [Solirubrobacteraceae bacterium]
MADIIVGYDGSECARAALDTAITAAAALGDSLVVVYAYEVSRLGGEVEDYAKALKERSDEVISHATHQAQAKGIEIETTVAEVDPATALVEIADERDARIIVVGTRGDHPLKAAIIGSVPHKLLQVTDRPVLVVPA